VRLIAPLHDRPDRGDTSGSEQLLELGESVVDAIGQRRDHHCALARAGCARASVGAGTAVAAVLGVSAHAPMLGPEQNP
jgi:hypothetical protein